MIDDFPKSCALASMLALFCVVLAGCGDGDKEPEQEKPDTRTVFQLRNLAKLHAELAEAGSRSLGGTLEERGEPASAKSGWLGGRADEPALPKPETLEEEPTL